MSYVVAVKSKVKISQNFVAFSEYMNFKRYFRLPPIFQKFMKSDFGHFFEDGTNMTFEILPPLPSTQQAQSAIV